MSDEFDALLVTTQLEREKADGIKSLIAASRLGADTSTGQRRPRRHWRG